MASSPISKAVHVPSTAVEEQRAVLQFAAGILTDCPELDDRVPEPVRPALRQLAETITPSGSCGGSASIVALTDRVDRVPLSSPAYGSTGAGVRMCDCRRPFVITTAGPDMEGSEAPQNRHVNLRQNPGWRCTVTLGHLSAD